MKFKKLVLYDFAEHPWDTGILNRLAQYADEVSVVLAPGEYCGALTPRAIDGADALIVRPFDNYPDSLFENSSLIYIGTTHTDVSHYNHQLLERTGITLRNVVGYSSASVAELTISIMLAWFRKLPGALQYVKQGNWGFEGFLGNEVRGKTLGIVGLGNIGSYVARIAQALGMEVLYYSPSRKPDAEASGIKYTDLSAMLSLSDVLSLHCVLSKETREIINQESFKHIKNGCMILNSARPELINMEACYLACSKGICSIWFDELQDQAWRKKLSALDNVWLTPDYGWWTEQAQARLSELTFRNIEEFLRMHAGRF